MKKSKKVPLKKRGDKKLSKTKTGRSVPALKSLPEKSFEKSSSKKKAPKKSARKGASVPKKEKKLKSKLATSVEKKGEDRTQDPYSIFRIPDESMAGDPSWVHFT
jgi:hypothetical protein